MAETTLQPKTVASHAGRCKPWESPMNLFDEEQAGVAWKGSATCRPTRAVHAAQLLREPQRSPDRARQHRGPPPASSPQRRGSHAGTRRAARPDRGARGAHDLHGASRRLGQEMPVGVEPWDAKGRAGLQGDRNGVALSGWLIRHEHLQGVACLRRSLVRYSQNVAGLSPSGH